MLLVRRAVVLRRHKVFFFGEREINCASMLSSFPSRTDAFGRSDGLVEKIQVVVEICFVWSFDVVISEFCFRFGLKINSNTFASSVSLFHNFSIWIIRPLIHVLFDELSLFSKVANSLHNVLASTSFWEAKQKLQSTSISSISIELYSGIVQLSTKEGGVNQGSLVQSHLVLSLQSIGFVINSCAVVGVMRPGSFPSGSLNSTRVRFSLLTHLDDAALYSRIT